MVSALTRDCRTVARPPRAAPTARTAPTARRVAPTARRAYGARRADRPRRADRARRADRVRRRADRARAPTCCMIRRYSFELRRVLGRTCALPLVRCGVHLQQRCGVHVYSAAFINAFGSCCRESFLNRKSAKKVRLQLGSRSRRSWNFTAPPTTGWRPGEGRE